MYIFVLYLVSNVARVSGLSILNFAPRTFSNVDQCYVKLILAMLFMAFGYVVYALWLCCLCPLVMLFMPFGYVVYALWLCCLCPLVCPSIYGFWLPLLYLQALHTPKTTTYANVNPYSDRVQSQKCDHIQHSKYHDICQCKSIYRPGTATKMWLYSVRMCHHSFIMYLYLS